MMFDTFVLSLYGMFVLLGIVKIVCEHRDAQ